MFDNYPTPVASSDKNGTKLNMISFQSLLSLYSDLGLIFIVDQLVIFDIESFAKFITQLVSPYHFAKLVS
jgi:hypothetical protein